LEFQALSSQVNDVSTDTTWNDQVLLDDSVGDFIFQAGQASGQTITVTIGNMGTGSTGLNISGESIDTYANSGDALTAISSALEKINSQRAEIGAGINRMEYAADNLTNVSSNATQSRSTIMDTDYALATTMLAKTQIIQQAATAMLAQANQQPQAVMTLLKG
jgi:flagellin